MEHPSNLYEESNQDFFCDASVRSSSEPPSFGEWNNLSANTETIGYQVREPTQDNGAVLTSAT
jgi:hypothetical protein